MHGTRNESWLSLECARTYVQGGRGKGVRVAILDSGVDSTHPDLARLRLADDVTFEETSGRIVSKPNPHGDRYGHGTAICGILNRLAPDVEIGSFQVLGNNLRSRTSIICEGAREALRRGYSILHCSFGCSRQDLVLDYKHWVDEAYVLGRHIVAAAEGLEWRTAEWPAHFSSVNAVTNVASAGAPDFFQFRAGSMVEFGANGSAITVPWLNGDRIKVTGSSFAAPVVTALLARLLSGAPGLGPLQAKSLLRLLASPRCAEPEIRKSQTK